MAANDDQIEPKRESLAHQGSHFKNAPATARFDAERRLLAEMNLPYFAERLVDASFSAESSQRTPDDPHESADQLQIGVGAFISGADMLGNPTEANDAIEELKQSLATKGKSKKAAEQEALVNLWIRAEPWLDIRELAELWAQFAAKLPGDPERMNRSRGADAQGEGVRVQGEER